MIRLIRSKGVGVWFVSQNPSDIPDNVLGQLGNRVQHALRAFTPKDQKAVKAVAQTMRANPTFDTERQSRTGDRRGVNLVSRCERKPFSGGTGDGDCPCSRMGPVTEDERNGLINHSRCMASTRMTWTGNPPMRCCKRLSGQYRAAK